MRILLAILALVALCVCLTGCDQSDWQTTNMVDPYGPAEL